MTDRNREDKDHSLDELISQTSEITNRLMKNLYSDFYGESGRTPGTGRKTDNIPGSSSDQNSTIEGRTAEKADLQEENGAAAAASAAEEKEPEKSGQEQLEALVGLKNVKHDVEELASLMKIQKMREDKGLNYVPTSLHLVFAGNPGTGKTTVARILAKLYREIGILSKGHLVEVDRSGLVAGYVGQTAIKTQEKIQEAMGGILFIDEAYTLAKDGDAFGQEAIDTILKAMEDHRRDFIVIAAGYTKPMEKFIESNPGLKSRFNKYLYFEDYSAEELIRIFEMQCEKYSYHLVDSAKEEADRMIRELSENKGENFANAREVRNLFEEIITNQARRAASLQEPTVEQLTEILPVDLHDDPVPDGSVSEETKEPHDDSVPDKPKDPHDDSVPDKPKNSHDDPAPEETKEQKAP